MKVINLFLFYSFFFTAVNAQISGRITDAQSCEPLEGAHVILQKNRTIYREVTGNSGRFSLNVPADSEMDLVVSYLGYKTFRKELSGNSHLTDLSIELFPAPVSVGEIVISSLRQDKFLKDISLPVSLVSREEINRSGGLTPAELLGNKPGLHIARDGIWATSINIRGLSEQRIVTLIDGSRVETATDIAAGLSMVDLNEIQRIEVIKGAASSLYGTGALGGVINIITRDGYFSEKLYTKVNADMSYQTVNNMHSEHAAFSLGDKKWYLRLSGTMRDAENTMTPEGELKNSQFTDSNIALKAGFRPLKNHEFRLNFQNFRAKDVGIPGGRPFPEPAYATYPEEKRLLWSMDYNFFGKGDILREIDFKYYHQFILRDVELIPNANVKITPKGYHTTNGISLKSKILPFPDHFLIAGIDVWQRNLKTERFKNIIQPNTDSSGNIISTNYIFRAETPIPETDFTSTGLYFNDEFHALNDKIKINFGGRFDLIHVKNEEAVDPQYIIINNVRNDNPPNQRITFLAEDNYNRSWSADMGILFSPVSDLDLTMSLSRAFRSPSIEERFKYIDLGSKVSIGEPDLQPEEGYFLDLGFKYWKERFHISLNGFVNFMSNLIVAEPGEVSYSYTGDPERMDTIPALINANVAEAMLFGYDLSIEYNFHTNFVIFGSSSFVRGLDTGNDRDLPLIPPFNGKIGVRYVSPGGLGIETNGLFVADQDKIVEGENQTEGYSIYNLRIFTPAIDIGSGHIRLYGGLENITNRAYINHLTTNRGLIRYEPGRNLYFRLQLEF